jgi:hypothetical protein
MRALEAVGITFLATNETTNGGPGVRLTAIGLGQDPIGLGRKAGE